ncbi:hypothetical protein ATANTOWER_013793 [Ataeniobius toweri]|uniref:Uncharacterized protein n=1 Tax=Ataeniobius toweri TaxID=208326 RepID=A0ABU7CEZ0_9TELE|nr:hypothetical protein [Ataeniobius toweri]
MIFSPFLCISPRSTSTIVGKEMYARQAARLCVCQGDPRGDEHKAEAQVLEPAPKSDLNQNLHSICESEYDQAEVVETPPLAPPER